MVKILSCDHLSSLVITFLFVLSSLFFKYSAYIANMASTDGITSVSHDSESTSPVRTQHQSTLAIHGDDHLNRSTDVAPALHVSTTFRYTPNPSELVPAKDLQV